jgi:hypothetical protein
LVNSVRPDVEVTVIPGIGHIDMTVKPAGTEAAVVALRGLGY